MNSDTHWQKYKNEFIAIILYVYHSSGYDGPKFKLVLSKNVMWSWSSYMNYSEVIEKYKKNVIMEAKTVGGAHVDIPTSTYNFDGAMGK